MAVCGEGRCTGCMACLCGCPEGAIHVSTSEKGFYLPKKDNDCCVGCGTCERLCPSLHNPVSYQAGKALACWINDATLREKSTSGGVFWGLAEEVLGRSGLVCGVTYDDAMSARHILTGNAEEAGKMRGSKYMQSRMGRIFLRCREALEQGRQLLFSGTPCQIAGLRNFLEKQYNGLLTVDLVCHGTPSPKVFHAYLRHLETQWGSRVTTINFRHKKPSWTEFSMRILFADGREYQRSCREDPFLLAFLRDFISNEACYRCPYASLERQGDITLGDFWGYVSRERRYRNTEQGISLTLCNTPRGEEAFSRIVSRFVVTERPIEEAMRANAPLRGPVPQNPATAAFWEAFLREENLFDSGQPLLRPQMPDIKRKLSLFIDDHTYWAPGLRGVYERAKDWLK